MSREEGNVELQIRNLPWLFQERYKKGSNISLFCRDCYRSLYSQFKKFVSDGMKSEVIVNIPIILLTGVPGTGKSMFSVYYLIKLMMDEEFPLKEVVLEHHQGVYNKITLTSQVNRFDPGGWTELELSVTQLQDPGRHLVFSDIITKEEPFKAGRWLFIFASPDPSRYRCTMKDARVGYRFTMPTWSEQELMTVVGDENKDEIYDRFVLFGGVPRYVLWKGPGQSPEQMLEDAIVSKGSGIMEYFSSNGHGDIDKDRSFMLVHLNPPRLSDDSDWDYQKPFEFSFASDEIFRRLIDKFDQSLLDSARSQFNNGAWSRSYGKGSAGHLFEKLVLWWTPIANKSVELTSLDNRANRLTATLPAMQLLPHLWEAKKGSKAGELEANCLYQPRITNLESADAFCVISEGEGPATLIVLQVTVGKTHPIKVNGLKKIVRAYPLTIQRALGKTLLVFVIPVNGALQGPQPLHTKGGTVAVSVPSEAQGFQQYVVEYAV